MKRRDKTPFSTKERKKERNNTRVAAALATEVAQPSSSSYSLPLSLSLTADQPDSICWNELLRRPRLRGPGLKVERCLRIFRTDITRRLLSRLTTASSPGLLFRGMNPG